MEKNTNSTVLVVEDNEDLRQNAALVLELEGYRVYTARDGKEGIDLLTQRGCMPDLIVSDIAMPRMDGYEFFQAVHKIPHLRIVPFIFLTAFGSRRDIRIGKQLGADDYLVKPFDADEFKDAVKNKLIRVRELRNHAEGQLEEARRAMVQLLSHELRTPLTYVTGGFSLLADGIEQDSHEVQFSMDLIKSGTQRLNRLAEQVVQYAELVSGNTRLQLEKDGTALDIEYLVKNAISMVERDLEERQIHYTFTSQLTAPVEVFGLQDVLCSAIYEVIRNAASYCVEESDVKVNIYTADHQAIVTISDSGRGILPEHQEKIWEILSQSERNKYEQQGAGMGLPLVKQIIVMHGGMISLKSTPQVGTTVTIELPIYMAG
jgi:signal transduction histidine kinase